MSEAGERFLASLHSLNEGGHILGPTMCVYSEES